MPRRLLGPALETLAWWGVLTLVWLAALTAYTAAEGVAAACAALAAAGVAPVARRAAGDRWRVGLGWLGVLPVLGVAVVSDSAMVVARLLSGRRGGPPKPALVRFDSDGPADDTRRAAATVIVSATPATVVLDSEEKECTLLVHRYGRSRVPLTTVLGLRPRAPEAGS